MIFIFLMCSFIQNWGYYPCLCHIHYVPKLTPDGHTIKEMCKFCSDQDQDRPSQDQDQVETNAVSQ